MTIPGYIELGDGPALDHNEAQAFDYIISLIYARSGIRLHEGKHHLIRARLAKRMRLLQIATLPDYCRYLRKSGDDEEITHAVDSLTTNFTHFMREEDHFHFLVQQALPSLLVRGQKNFRVWSAACASGEEPYTLAFFLTEHFPPMSGWNWQVVASDISTKVLDKAQQGIYPEDRLTGLPAGWMRKYFQRGQNQWKGHFRVKPQLTERVEFRHINLLEDYDFPFRFEVIFCRNVMIYFDRTTQEKIVRRLAQFLEPQGFLLVGHAESITGLSVPFKCLRPSIYQKV